MQINKRLFPRTKVNIKVVFEFVKWNVADLDLCKASYEASIIDISAKGASLSKLPDIDKGVLKKLSQTGKEDIDETQYGFEFIDIPGTAFERIKKFVESAGN